MENAIREFVQNLNEQHLEKEPLKPLSVDDLEQIDLLAEYEYLKVMD